MRGATHFLHALARLDGPCMVEHSVKVTGDLVADGRLLVSAPRRALLPGAKRTFRAICDDLAAPDITTLLPHLNIARDVHFGFEPGPTPVHKAYLEFGENPPVENLRFMALKWRGGEARCNLYFDRTALPISARIDLVTQVVPPGPVAQMLITLLRQAQHCTPLHDLPLLLVEEQGTPRRSIDLNLSDLGWRIGDIAGLPLPSDIVPAHHPIGHIAAGTARDGQVFFTVYHGARPANLGQTARL